MNTQTQEALKMAIEALEQAEKQLREYWNKDIKRGYDIEEMNESPIILCKDTIQACKEAILRDVTDIDVGEIAQPAQEPVASTWIHEGHEYPTMVEVMPVIEYHTGKPTDDNNDYINAYMPPYTKLYTHPAPSWQGLSDDEKRKIWFKLEHEIGESIVYGGKLARAIEQALKEKNGFSDVKEKNHE